MANENKLTTLGQMRDFAEQQDARDDAQEEQLRSHTHNEFNLTQSGFVPAPMVLGGVSRRVFLRADGEWTEPPDTVYTHPSYAAKPSGLYKVTVDSTGHVSNVEEVTKEDINALGIPDTVAITTAQIDAILDS